MLSMFKKQLQKLEQVKVSMEFQFSNVATENIQCSILKE